MANILFLAHRLPYPPNKGDKVRSFNLLRQLSARHRVFVGTFVDDPEDRKHVAELRKYCADVHVEFLDPLLARIASAKALLQGQALTLAYYRHSGMTAWVRSILRDHAIKCSVVFSSAMYQYVRDEHGLSVLCDLVDVDSAKWTQYSSTHAWPLSWLYRREGARLLACERDAAIHAMRTFFVTDAEARMFESLAPDCMERVMVSEYGVDTAYFDPCFGGPTPFAPGRTPIVFTGAMDYWPNVDASVWFASEVMERLRARRPDVDFHIVGMRPVRAVRELASSGVHVIGAVADMRPYLQHAAVVVAPLRIARGVQNKVLEAMAMARPVVAHEACAIGIDAARGSEFEVAADADAFCARIAGLLDNPQRAAAMGRAARERVVARYSWPASLARFDELIASAVSAPVRTHTAPLSGTSPDPGREIRFTPDVPR